MFDRLNPAPPDAILGLAEAYRADPRTPKVNLTVGVYCDEDGTTPVLQTVRSAAMRLLQQEATKVYLPIDGLPAFREAVAPLVLGPQAASRPVVAVQTPGGTGGLRVAAEWLARNRLARRIWCSRPTWANHPSVFNAAGLEVESYAYLNAQGTDLDEDAFLTSLRGIPAGDVVCLHACCHNPTGVDPAPDVWQDVVAIASERHWLPLVDFAYQGFAEGIEEDRAVIDRFLEAGIPFLVASSCSKNFGLYSERVGALFVVAERSAELPAIASRLKQVVRANYSNPPRHGAEIVAEILSDESLRAQWKTEVAQMRHRIARLRCQLVDALQRHGADHDMSFIERQRGMFSFTGLSPDQVDRLREEHAVYMVRSGRANIAGLNASNIETVARAIAAVIRETTSKKT